VRFDKNGCVRRVAGVLLIGGAALCFAACSGSNSAHPSTSRGAGVVLAARFQAHGNADADAKAIQTILLHRFGAVGARDAAVDVDATRGLVRVRIPAGQVPPPALQRLLLQTAELRFRPVAYSGTSPLIFVFSAKPSAQIDPSARAAPFPGCAALIKKSPPDTDAAANVVLPDRGHQLCYVLGPAVVTGASIASSATADDPNQGWVATVKFKNNDFVDKLARPYVGMEVAIEVDGVVQSAPTIQPGIVGRDVQISGQFTKSEAQNLALLLRYGALPVQLRFVSATPAR